MDSSEPADDAWIAAIDRALAADDALASATPERLVIDQVVETADGERAYHLEVGGGRPGRAAAGRSGRATVTFTTDGATALAIREGRLGAQAAFMTGRLRVGGDVSALLVAQGALRAAAAAAGRGARDGR